MNIPTRQGRTGGNCLLISDHRDISDCMWPGQGKILNITVTCAIETRPGGFYCTVTIPCYPLTHSKWIQICNISQEGALCVKTSCIFWPKISNHFFAEQSILHINGSAKPSWSVACSCNIFCLHIITKLWRGRGKRLQGQQAAQRVQHCQVPQWWLLHRVRHIRGLLHSLGVWHSRSGITMQYKFSKNTFPLKEVQGLAPAPVALEFVACSVELVDRQLEWIIRILRYKLRFLKDPFWKRDLSLNYFFLEYGLRQLCLHIQGLQVRLGHLSDQTRV